MTHFVTFFSWHCLQIFTQHFYGTHLNKQYLLPCTNQPSASIEPCANNNSNIHFLQQATSSQVFPLTSQYAVLRCYRNTVIITVLLLRMLIFTSRICHIMLTAHFLRSIEVTARA